jgi:predicted aspartyl protease
MGQFRVRATLIGPTGLTEDLDLLVDTDATYLTVPADVAGRLGLRVLRDQPIVTAGGRHEVWPVAEARLVLEGREAPTVCFIAPAGPSLLGAVALESLSLGVDPVARRLVPVDGFVLAGAALTPAAHVSRIRHTASRPMSWRATISFMTSAVPSPISRPITSRIRCSKGSSFV